MDVTITELDGVTKAGLTGRLDTANVNRIEMFFTASVMPKGQNTIVDLTEVTFIASLGLRMLLSAARGLSRRGARLAMFGANPAVMEIIETVALGEIIPVVPTEADAIAAVSA